MIYNCHGSPLKSHLLEKFLKMEKKEKLFTCRLPRVLFRHSKMAQAVVDVHII